MTPPPAVRSLAWPDRIAWGCLGLGAAGWAWGLARTWGADPGNADRGLVLIGAAWAAWETARPAADRPRPVAGLLLLAMAAAALPLAWYLQARVGVRNLLLWWQWAALAGGAAGLLLARGGPAHARAFAFPLVFPAFALTIPFLVLRPLKWALQELTTGVAHFTLANLGTEVVRIGYVLRLPSADLGVAEACSGIRSLPALTAIAGFIAHLYGFGPARGALLVVLAIPVVLAANILRVVLSALIQETAGPEYVQGAWHEALGFAMIFVGLGLILLEAEGLARGATPAAPAAPAEPPAPTPAGDAPRPRVLWPGWVAAALLGTATVAAVGSGVLGQVNATAAVTAVPDLAALPTAIGGWTGRAQAETIPPGVAEMLAFDAAIYRIYTNNLGQELHVWVVYWAVGSQIRGRHDPDVCWPARGFERKELWTEPVPACGTTVPVTARMFARPKTREQQFLLCWSQDGRVVAFDEAAPPPALVYVDPQEWVADLLGVGGGAAAAGPRLMVLVGTMDTSPTARAAAIAFTANFADELYFLCPWAAPVGSVTGAGKPR